MKIIVLHGEDTEKSYLRLKKFIDTAKDRSWEVNYLDESPLSLRENISSTSLFETERFFILTDFQKIAAKDLTWLKKNYKQLQGTLIVYHEGPLSQTTLKSLPEELKIEEYKLPKLLWSFLEHIYPGNSQTVLTEFHKIIERDAVEFVFSLIARQFKNLFLVSLDESITSLPDWQVTKLRSQANKFDIDNIRFIISELSKIDIDVKTGKADLVSSLDLLIVKSLK